MRHILETFSLQDVRRHLKKREKQKLGTCTPCLAKKKKRPTREFMRDAHNP